MSETTPESANTKAALDDVPDPMKVPLPHRFALTMFMATQSRLQQIKNNDGPLTTFLQKSLKAAGIPDSQIPHYKAAIKKFDSDATLKKALEDLGPMLVKVMGGQFYPTDPCPNEDASVQVMSQLK
jgi:hypothetical protein